MRTLVIGDIHGSLNALKQALARANYDFTSDRLIFLGDYCDGWSQTAEVAQFIIDIIKEGGKVIALRGNHDVWMNYWLADGKGNPTWAMNGGETSIQSYINTGLLTSKDHKDFYNNLLPYFVDKQLNMAFVHAGISMNGSGKVEDETNDHFHFWSRDMVNFAMTEHDYDNPHYEHVFVGHTPTINFGTELPITKGNLTIVDTGAGWRGPLTVMDVETKEYWQSDFTDKLHPGEEGRGYFDINRHLKK